jgi:hypothetical protein
MRRLSVFLVAGMVMTLVLTLGATGATAKIKKKKSFDTTVTATFAQGAPSGEEYYSSATFSGKVGSEKNRCVRDRNVIVRRPNGSSLGQAKSGSNGDWTLLGAIVGSGQYTVQVEKSKIIKKKTKNNGEKVKKKIVCQPVTRSVTVP